MAKLNKKQLALLKEIPADQLMQIICDIAENNGQAKSFIINKYLLTPEESLKKAEAEYKRVIKTKRFYDYYEAAVFLEQYVILEEESVKCYNLWNKAFSAEELHRDLGEAGFHKCEFYDDISGKNFTENSNVICVAAYK